MPRELLRWGCAKLDIARALDAQHIVERKLPLDGHAGAAPHHAGVFLQIVELGLGQPFRRGQAGSLAALDRDARTMGALEQSDEILRQAIDIETDSRLRRYALLAVRLRGGQRHIICLDFRLCRVRRLLALRLIEGSAKRSAFAISSAFFLQSSSSFCCTGSARRSL
jgi:hypothetical protein